jgi:hypothetical protein
MEKKGLCTTCIEVKTCTFVKDAPIWQCEEFSSGIHTTAKRAQIKSKRVVSCEVATESE